MLPYFWLCKSTRAHGRIYRPPKTHVRDCQDFIGLSVEGPRIPVELDETYLCKNKCLPGHLGKDQWLLEK
ncbi:hypothetical protein HZS_5884 [Henneguya salminicola]|nr:hypothetical protein HZS_5884 [Henneguya salminicola]